MLIHSMFEPFSQGYYVGRMYVEPHEGERALIHRAQHEAVNRQLYTTGTGIERLDNPLVMKLDCHHFPVHGDAGVPEDTLAIPRSIVQSDDVDTLPAVREILLAKADRAVQLLELFTPHDGPAGI